MDNDLEISFDIDIEKQTECCICYEDIKNEEITTTNCEHFFCEKCLLDWIKKTKSEITCPLCRSEITEYEKNDIKNKLVIINRENISQYRTNEMSTIINNLRYQNKKYKIYSLFLISLFLYRYIDFCILYNKYSNLQSDYDLCSNNLTLYSQTELVNTYLLKPDTHDLMNCKIPIYYFNKCFNIYE